MLIKYFSRTVSLVLKLLAWQHQETTEKKSEVFTFRANALCGHSRNFTIDVALMSHQDHQQSTKILQAVHLKTSTNQTLWHSVASSVFPEQGDAIMSRILHRQKPVLFKSSSIYFIDIINSLKCLLIFFKRHKPDCWSWRFGGSHIPNHINLRALILMNKSKS